MPVAHVDETLRPRAVEAVRDAPPCVIGAAVVRGVATPVVDASALLGGAPLGDAAGRWVSLRLGGERRVALAVTMVDGLVDAATIDVAAAPPLLGAADAVVVAELGQLDGQLVAVLATARLLPEDFRLPSAPATERAPAPGAEERA